MCVYVCFRERKRERMNRAKWEEIIISLISLKKSIISSTLCTIALFSMRVRAFEFLASRRLFLYRDCPSPRISRPLSLIPCPHRWPFIICLCTLTLPCRLSPPPLCVCGKTRPALWKAHFFSNVEYIYVTKLIYIIYILTLPLPSLLLDDVIEYLFKRNPHLNSVYIY